MGKIDFELYDECAHSDEPHTIWYWIDDPNDPSPAPYAIHRDNQKDAVDLVMGWFEQGLHPSYRWIKVFRSSNESYTCFKWTRRGPEFSSSRHEDVDSGSPDQFVEWIYGPAKKDAWWFEISIAFGVALIIAAIWGF